MEEGAFGCGPSQALMPLTVLMVRVRQGVRTLASWVVLVIASVAMSSLAAYAYQLRNPCEEGDASRTVAQLNCVQEDQLSTLRNYPHSNSTPRLLRETLAVASEVVRCLGDFRTFPVGQHRNDFHCLQHQVLEFYEGFQASEVQPANLRAADLLARASLRIHYCMLDRDQSLSRCLTLVEEALADTRDVFRQVARIQADPGSSSSAEMRERLGLSEEIPLPPFSHLVAIVDLSLENSRRFPLLLGEQFGAALGPVLCDAYEIYPEQKDYIASLYNLLIAFDDANMASSAQLERALKALVDLFRPTPELASFLQVGKELRSGEPCQPDSFFAFPDLELRKGYFVPNLQKLDSRLGDIEKILGRMGEFGQRRENLWSPFRSYGALLLKLGESLRVAALRSPDMWLLRHRLMERARDAFLLRKLEMAKHPRETEPLLAAIDQQIAGYAEQLLNDLRLESLIPFVEEYLDSGERLLTLSQKQRLHRLLAIGYAIEGNDVQSQLHLKLSNMGLDELTVIQERLKAAGVGLEIRQDAG